MTWTYSDPTESDKDAVRFLVGDTNSADPLVTDEEITYLLAEHGDVFPAAIAAAESLAYKFAREVSHSADGLSWSGSDLHKHFLTVADRLKQTHRRSRAKSARPYVGGISRVEREKDDADDDLIQTHFRSGGMDNPRKGSHEELRPDQ